MLAIVAIAVAVIVKTFLSSRSTSRPGSMEKTLHGCPSCNGDKILVNKPIFDFRSPHPGDIVVFSLPAAWPKTPGESPVAPKTNVITGPVRWFGQLVGVIPPDREDLVKRVIAVGGQTVKCCDSQGRVQVSDTGPSGPFRSLDEPFTYLHEPDGPEMPFTAVTVPHGRLWVMGDHRTDSADSRFHCIAGQDQATASGGKPCDPVASTVPISNVIGKAFVIAWPPSRWRTLGTPHTFKALSPLPRCAHVRPAAGRGRVRGAAALVLAPTHPVVNLPVPRTGCPNADHRPGRPGAADRGSLVRRPGRALAALAHSGRRGRGGRIVAAGRHPRGHRGNRSAHRTARGRVTGSRPPPAMVVGRRRLRPDRPLLRRPGRARLPGRTGRRHRDGGPDRGRLALVERRRAARVVGGVRPADDRRRAGRAARRRRAAAARRPGWRDGCWCSTRPGGCSCCTPGQDAGSERTNWVAPGGGVEADESVLDAAARELFEETGIVATFGARHARGRGGAGGVPDRRLASGPDRPLPRAPRRRTR